MSNQLTPEIMEQRIIEAISNDESIPQRKRDKAIAKRTESKWTSYERVKRIADEYVELGVIKPGDTILDVGCGHGLIALPLIEMGCKYIGLEVSLPCVNRSMRVFNDVDGVEFHHLDVKSEKYSNPVGERCESDVTFPVDELSVDSVIARSLFTHFKSIQGVSNYLSEMHRCLKDNGLKYSTYFTSPPNGPCDEVNRRVFPKTTIESYISVSGFEIIKSWGGTTTERDDQWKIIAQKS